MVAHVEEIGGRLVVQILVTKGAGMFKAEIPKSATPVEMALFLTQLRTIYERRRKKEPDNEAG